jgi:DNA-binding beta-propeller fold protein YncE
VSDGDLDGPSGVVVNSKGNVIIADTRNGKVKAIDDDGKYLWHCEMPVSECPVSNVPVAIAADQHDQIFATYYKESTNEYTIVKFDPNGTFLCSFDTRYCFAGLGHDVKPRGMSINSKGLIHLGDAGNGCIHVLESNGTSLSTRILIRTSDLLSQFSFYVGPDDKIVVATSEGILIFHEDGIQKKVVLKDEAQKVNKGKPLALTYDINQNVFIVLTGQVTIKNYPS